MCIMSIFVELYCVFAPQIWLHNLGKISKEYLIKVIIYNQTKQNNQALAFMSLSSRYYKNHL